MREDAARYFAQKNLPYVKPFYTVNQEDEGDILDWFRTTDTYLQMYYQPVFREQKANLRIFLSLGVNPNFFSPMVAVYLQQGVIDDQPDEIFINEFYRLVMDSVSLVVSNELTAQVLPNNDDYKDKIAAKFVKMWLDSYSYDLDIDLQRIKWEIQKNIFGEAFVIPEWDEEAGDLLKEAKVYANEDIFMVDEQGREIVDEQGKLIKVRKYLRHGDVTLANPMPYHVMLDPKFRYEDCNWFYWVDWMETEYLEKKYNQKFRQAEGKVRYDAVGGFDKTTQNHTLVYKFYHRSHPFLPEGRYIMCTEDVLLVNKTLIENPSLIENRKLPLIRFSEMDIGIGTRCCPMLARNTRPITSGINRLTNQIYNNLEAESPKIFVHETSGVDAQRMPNGICVMEWRGNHKPSIETPQTNTSSIFKFRDDLKKNLLEMGMTTPMTRGDTPNAQLDSFIALQHFEDQRVQLAAPSIKNHIKSMEHLFRNIISCARDHYDEDEDRLIKIVGRNNKVNLKYFKPENLQKVYDVKLSTTGNLANSKAARTQLMMTIKREFPNVIPDELFVDMLGLSQSEKFTNSVTAAVNSAESENEDMLNGEPIQDPERYEDLITHWDSHRIPMQTMEFKTSPEEIKDLFERHMTATEKLMYEQARESPGFQQRLLTLRQFPMFYFPTPLNEPPQPMMPEGQEFGGVPEENLSAPAEDMGLPPFDVEEEQAAAAPAENII